MKVILTFESDVKKQIKFLSSLKKSKMTHSEFKNLIIQLFQKTNAHRSLREALNIAYTHFSEHDIQYCKQIVQLQYNFGLERQCFMSGISSLKDFNIEKRKIANTLIEIAFDVGTDVVGSQ